MNKQIKILGTGKYLPKREVGAPEIAERLNIKTDWVLKRTGVAKRYFADGKIESTTYMGAEAAKQALENAKIHPKDLSLIISASGVAQQPIPCNGVFIQEKLGLSQFETPAFDINCTCLSFMPAFNLASHLIASGEHTNILIVSSDIASVGIDWSHKESACLFGDGAAAVVVGPNEASDSEESKIESYKMISLGQHHDICNIKGGLSNSPAMQYKQANNRDYLFQMDGTKLFKISSRYLPRMVDGALEPLGLTMNDVSHVIPHQASMPSIRILQKKLNIPDHKLANIVANHGNIIAASIPMALHETIESEAPARGSKMLFIGTSAGLSLAVMLITF
ncbi:MAG: beta-ketoacyl-ACP synthase 3 [Oligoflexales bacterium]|nr:beta-ketoacyl-ACP synthase 3 [Oligoflexales bacterium]